jgi:hypothetical protein
MVRRGVVLLDQPGGTVAVRRVGPLGRLRVRWAILSNRRLRAFAGELEALTAALAADRAPDVGARRR